MNRIKPIFYFSFCLLLLPGCTPHFRWQAIHDERIALNLTRQEPAPLNGYTHLAGVIHVHTELSHDSQGTLDEIVAAAKANGLGYVILTDHHKRIVYEQGFDGEREGVFLIRGSEIIKGCKKKNAALCNSLLVIGLPEPIDHQPLTMQEVVDEVLAQGGLALVAHPEGFTDWTVTGFQGIEIFDTLDAAMKRKWRWPKLFFDVIYSFRRYPEELYLTLLEKPLLHLDRWDEEIAKRPTVGVGGNDAHQNIRILGRQLDPYALSFKIVRTHLWIQEVSREGIFNALRSGHAYVAFDVIAEAGGVQVWAESPGADQPVVAGIMGDRIEFREHLTLQVRSPIVGRMRLIRDGKLVAAAVSKHHGFRLDGPGAYRVEIWAPLRGEYRPWVYANPVYVRGGESGSGRPD